MNEQAVRKLAEVQAFLLVSTEICKRTKNTFSKTEPQIYKELISLSEKEVASKVPKNKTETFNSKTDKTITKLTQMMELYIGDEWDNPVEVLEWLSFFTGAASAHCAIANTLSSDANSKKSDYLIKIQSDYRLLLDAVIVALSKK